MFFRSVRPTSSERAQPMPGDTLIPDAVATLTHSITIGREPQDVWPWLAQMGAGTRAGWYSYDVLDNGGQPSASRIRPDLQHLDFGMLMPALPGSADGFTLLAYDRDHFLVIGWRDGDGMLLMTWAFMLEETPGGTTRLIVRARGGRQYRFHGSPWWLTRRVVPAIHFVMQRKQLLGIAQRAEATELRGERGLSRCRQPSLQRSKNLAM
jgi:hypothetical protein